MTYIIISDIHGNLQAFESVVKSFPKTGDDVNIICAGDIVGYGADPDKCIDMVQSIGAQNVLGNHDAAAVDKTDISNFNENAARAAFWTKEYLDQTRRDYLEMLPFVLENDLFTVAHGTLHNPEEFMYMVGSIDAMRTFELLKTKICFVGHTHAPCAFIFKNGRVYQSFESSIIFEKDVRYIINVGSVGQPRDYNNRACYCIYYAEEDRIEFQRVEYDVECARQRIIDAGLPTRLGDRLLQGR